MELYAEGKKCVSNIVCFCFNSSCNVIAAVFNLESFVFFLLNLFEQNKSTEMGRKNKKSMG